MHRAPAQYTREGGGACEISFPHISDSRGDGGDEHQFKTLDLCVRALHAQLLQLELDPVAHRQVVVLVLLLDRSSLGTSRGETPCAIKADKLWFANPMFRSDDAP